MADSTGNKSKEAGARLVRALAAALKNSSLYPAGHPTLAASLTSLVTAARAWVGASDKRTIGVSPENLLVDGTELCVEGDRVCEDFASHAHQRGVIAVTIHRDVGAPEFARFLSLLAREPRAIAGAGGIAANMPSSPHLVIREIDYEALLKARAGKEGEGPRASGADLWRSLIELSETGTGEALPASTAEFVNQFLADPEKSAAVLTGIYKEAVARVDDNATIERMRQALIGVSRYFERHGGRDMGEVRHDIADIILRLDPALVARLFESDGGAAGMLSDEILKSLPDDTVADFVASLIGREGAVNKHLLTLFDKLTHEDHRCGNMTALVADKLFDMKFLDKDLISRLQLSVKDMMQADPQNSFLNEMYKMTVEAFVDTTVGLAYRSDEYLRVARESAEALKYDSIERQGIRVILNLLWLERDPADFTALVDILLKKFDESVDILYIQAVREVYELFIERLDPSVKNGPAFRAAVIRVLDTITAADMLRRVITLIGDSGPFELNNITRIMTMTRPPSVRLLVDAYAQEEDMDRRDRIGEVIGALGPDIAGELRRRLERPDGIASAAILGLFQMARRIDPQEMQDVSRLMLRSANSRVRMEALSFFTPRTQADAAALIDILRAVEGEDVGNKIIFTLLKSEDARIIASLFRAVRAPRLRKRYLEQTVKLCGDFKVAAAFGPLRDVFLWRPLFMTRFVDTVRVAALVSLAQIATPEAMKLVRGAARDRSGAVRRMSAIVLELGAKDRAGKGPEPS